MNTIKYIKRKYPNDSEDILKDFNTDEVDFYVKKRKYRIGKLSEQINDVEIYPKGTICLYKGLKDYDEDGYWVGTWRKHIIIKCHKNNITESGYISLTPTIDIIECK